MLDTNTKRKIDNARDILVGKIPDPKSQVEQITIAMIYKFMDDMDIESVDMGGKAKFFAGEYSKYSWRNIMSPKLGGHDRLAVYAEGIEKMNQNPNIPQLFRDIFKGAFLPYRDPETLNLFLKEINEFSYEHSERLGDAFEYLLSVLGSQGDAGQFRTPRHIIDFVAQVVNPQKNETILDPACGTAGFLISAYKHILNSNPKISITDKNKLMKNFVGYDISHDMVRLSRVNMFLHQFPDPHIHEYDTLTSEERWDETFDVILANPPFMTPKGGIRPHNRFSIQANRSEVLFVDYIAEHLSGNGRAGVIVPEGIIFQSGNAYKDLRKMLIEKHLYAVVSLPAGVFNPYSGVKTSILLMDKQLAKKADNILFVKIENDGYGLGAQRREIDKNDLPDAANVIADYIQAVHSGTVEAFRSTDKPCGALLVSKAKLAENGEYNLTGDRYRTTDHKKHHQWPMVKLGEVLLRKPQYGSGASKTNYDGSNRYVRITDITERGTLKSEDLVSPSILENDCLLNDDDFLIARSGSVGRAYLHKSQPYKCYFAGYLIRFPVDITKLNPNFLFALTKSEHYSAFITKYRKDGTIGNINAQEYSELTFPLPPLEVQREIVAEIEGYQRIIDGARQVVDSWKPQIEIDPDWEIKPLGEVITLQRGYDLPKTQFVEGSVPVVGSNGIIGYHNEPKEKGPGVVTGRSGTIGKVHFINNDYYWPHNTALFVKEFNGNDRKFIKFLLESIDLKSLGDNVAAVPSLDRKNAHRVTVSIPPLEIQREIVAAIEAEHRVVDGCKELIATYEAKIKKVIDKVWEG